MPETDATLHSDTAPDQGRSLLSRSHPPADGINTVRELNAAERAALNWIHQLAAVNRANLTADSEAARWRHTSVAEMLLDHGRLFTPSPSTTTGPARACYRNASQQVAGGALVGLRGGAGNGTLLAIGDVIELDRQLRVPGRPRPTPVLLRTGHPPSAHVLATIAAHIPTTIGNAMAAAPRHPTLPRPASPRLVQLTRTPPPRPAHAGAGSWRDMVTSDPTLPTVNSDRRGGQADGGSPTERISWVTPSRYNLLGWVV